MTTNIPEVDDRTSDPELSGVLLVVAIVLLLGLLVLLAA